MDQREVWDDGVGAGWVRNADLIDMHSAVFGDAARDSLLPLEGLRVLDVGCGTGTTTLELLDHGAREAVGIDLSATMIDFARERSVGAAGVSFIEGDVTTLGSHADFDAVYSRFGVMFFNDPVAAFAGLRDQARSGGKLAFASWRGPFENPWMTTAVIASAPVLGSPDLPGPGQPGPFSLAEPDDVRSILTNAGWRDIGFDTVSMIAPHPAGDSAAVAAMLIDNVPPLAMGLAANPTKAGELHRAIVDALRPHEVDGRVVLAASALITTARR